MAPPQWALRALEPLLAPGALLAPAGLLIGAPDSEAHQITLLGAAPLPAGASAQDTGGAAAKVLALLPQGAHVVGCYGLAAPPPLAAPGCPAVGAQLHPGAPPAFTLGGAAAAAASVAAPAGALAPDGFAAVRCHCQLLLRVEHPTGAGPTPAALARAFGELERQLAAPGAAFASDPRPGEPLVMLTGATQGSVADALRPALAAAAAAGDPCPSLRPLADASRGEGRPEAPVLEWAPAAEGTSLTEALVSLDALALLPAGAPARGAAAGALAQALLRQLGKAERQLAARLQPGGGGGGAVVPVGAHHFMPPGWHVPLTACYPRGSADADAAEAQLLPAREALHALLGLPGDVPMLRLANALVWGGGGGGAAGGGDGKGGRLRDVHLGLAPPAFGGAPSLIRGSYEYYHYMQDRFNDSGWGCAYRSLQTIVSWFRAQRYTSKPVPSHREIQQMLVKIGDKDPSFIGSSNWIGAIELSYILGEYLGITCKIMTVSRGSDIPQHARELAAHFASQGTPVMIGGGVLAYTLLGVQFDELTGDAAFLILDPHYTGGEDLKKIQQGTWVAWKTPGDNAAAGGPLYVADTFYNFLLPQRPATV